MGANAQTSVPTFTAGEVLTAANMNISARTGIPVFADETARNNGFGGTGEKVLAEGQFAYLEDSNTTQYYDGAAWQPVGVAPGLVLVSSTTIGSAVSSVTVSNAFSSTYDNYKIIVSGGIASTNNRLNLTFGATATGYYRFTIYGNYTSITVTGENASNTDKFADAGTGSANSLVSNIEVFAPNLAKRTSIIAHTSTSEVGQYVFMQQGFLNDSTQYTAFTLTTSAGTITGGTIKVYGYANS